MPTKKNTVKKATTNKTLSNTDEKNKKPVASKPAEKKAATTNKIINTKAVEQPKIEVLDSNIYPIGKANFPSEFSDEVITKLIQDIRVLPDHLKSICKKINKNKKLQYSYRDGGWNIEQIVHHIADSHMNAYIRFKLALTENNPTIKVYDQDLWAETADVQLPLKTSVKLLNALHKKWTALLENMDKNDFKRTYFHPGYNVSSSLQQALALYAWHGKHHVAQIDVALKIN